VHRPLGCLLDGQGRPKKGHQAVAGEFVHRAFVAVHVMDERLVEFIHDGKKVFLPELLTQDGIADEIGKQHGDELALAFQPAPIGEDFFGQVLGYIALQLLKLSV